MQKRRYEILLPLKHNDGRPVSQAVLYQTREDLLSEFDGVAVDPHSVLGVWQHGGERYEDELARITVDVDDTPENQAFFTNFKQLLLERFEQVEIYMISFPIERI